SIIQNVENYKIKLRKARGYAPTHIKIEKDLKNKVLCLGANQKSTIALGFKNNFNLSPYIGDLNSISSMEYFNRTINSSKNFYDFVPDTVVCDL
ncbi:carbamoyltransferase HypF, partial [Aliarcobacter butzleri]